MLPRVFVWHLLVLVFPLQEHSLTYHNDVAVVFKYQQYRYKAIS